MTNTFFHLLSIGAFCVFSLSCQSITPDQRLSDLRPTAAKPLPNWTKKKKKAQSNQKIRIMTKLIEISRPIESTDIPSKGYERKLTKSEYQLFLREIAQKKDTHIMTTPSVIIRDGENATVEIIREFIYPNEPGDNAKMETENTGVTSHILARHIRSNDISIKSFTRISEFTGFSEVQSEFHLPIFKRQDAEISTHLKSGETIITGGILSETTQKVEDKGPLGIINKRYSNKFSTELMIAVTATLINADEIPRTTQ